MGFLDIFRVNKIIKENQRIEKELADLKSRVDELGITEYDQMVVKIQQDKATMEAELQEERQKLQAESDIISNTIEANTKILSTQKQAIDQYQEEKLAVEKDLVKKRKQLRQSVDTANRINYLIKNYIDSDFSTVSFRIPEYVLDEAEELAPSVMLNLHCMDVKSLRKASRENDKEIEKLLKAYLSRYTTKANRAIYQLMVIALRAELQNILIALKYDKLDKAIESVKEVARKYLMIAVEGNQSILPTITRFTAEIEYLFINQVKIEYNYYVKKEQARQEQLAIRQQMREEAEERKHLEQQKKQIEKEEAKYIQELERNNALLESSTDPVAIEKLASRKLELESLLSDVLIKKDEIVTLQNGKAGNVYIISNIGSFGEDVFKVGMTRRINPQDRVNELGDASVPFKFDVHSFIFSDDAVSLEKKMHEALEVNRLNKVNRRKEFFKVDIDTLEKLVTDIDPTAEFNRTMAAEEFRQSLSSDVVYTDSLIWQDDDE